ncbi:uncharacterized protein [Ptychodera flava]|uniref:uncharacterized protein isoform X2 n=1 Tax=Ptychodera flava TaxID=63121 RepID=UPI003969BD4C
MTKVKVKGYIQDGCLHCQDYTAEQWQLSWWERNATPRLTTAMTTRKSGGGATLAGCPDAQVTTAETVQFSRYSTDVMCG